MKKFLLAVAVFAFALTSCETVSQTAHQQFVKGSPTYNMTTASLDVASQRVSYTFTPTKAESKGGTKSCINIAIQKALEPSGSDVMVETQTNVVKKRKLFGTRITSVTVTGHPAKYVNFKSADSKFLFDAVTEGKIK